MEHPPQKVRPPDPRGLVALIGSTIATIGFWLLLWQIYPTASLIFLIAVAVAIVGLNVWEKIKWSKMFSPERPDDEHTEGTPPN